MNYMMKCKLLIQLNVVDESSMASFSNIVSAMGIEHDVVNFINGKVFSLNGEEFSFNSQEHYYMPFGSVAFLSLVSHKIQNVVSFSLRDFSHMDWIEKFGNENMLNPNPIIVSDGVIPWDGDELFVRPLSTAKHFKGGIYTKDTFKWHAPCMVSRVVEIEAEYRFFIIHGAVIGKSRYALHGLFDCSTDVPGYIEEFACIQAGKFDFPTFVIDVAKTKHGLKIVELNCTQTAGMYQCDKYKLAKHFTSLFSCYHRVGA